MNFVTTTAVAAMAATGPQQEQFPPLPPLPFPIADIKQFVAGLIQGVLHVNRLNDIEHCMGDGVYTAGEMLVIFKDVKTK